MPLRLIVMIGSAGVVSSLLMTPPPSATVNADMLAMAATASARPVECNVGGARSSAKRTTVWDRAREPHLQRYCDLLARAQAKLLSEPVVAREAATLADRVVPGHSAAWVLRGRANVQLRNYAEAAQDFARARQLEPRSIEDPLALRDHALALRKVGNLQDALATYRVLVPRLVLLPTTDERVEVMVEAASLAMATGEAGLGEATALLTEARSQPLSKYDGLALAMLGLALDRAGFDKQAASVMERLTDVGARGVYGDGAVDPAARLANSQETTAVAAWISEATDPKQAAQLWQKYVSLPGAPFVKHAQGRLTILGRGRTSRP